MTHTSPDVDRALNELARAVVVQLTPSETCPCQSGPVRCHSCGIAATVSKVMPDAAPEERAIAATRQLIRNALRSMAGIEIPGSL